MRQADVASIEAIDSFRAHFLTYLPTANLALDQASEEIKRTRLWLQNDQRTHWEREVRQRKSALEQARAQLLSARLLKLVHSAETAKLDFRRAERALAEAETKLACVRHELRRFDSVMAPKQKDIDRLRSFLTEAGPQAAVFLRGVVDALQAYSETRAAPPPRIRPAPPATTEQTAPDSTAPGEKV